MCSLFLTSLFTGLNPFAQYSTKTSPCYGAVLRLIRKELTDRHQRHGYVADHTVAVVLAAAAVAVAPELGFAVGLHSQT